MTTMYVELAAIPFQMSGKPEPNPAPSRSTRDENPLPTIVHVARTSGESVARTIALADELGMKFSPRSAEGLLSVDQAGRLIRKFSELRAGVGTSPGSHGA